MSQRDDAPEVDSARGGDADAFGALAARYQIPLYNLALRMVGEPSDAADITQEALLRAWEHIGKLRGAPFKAWLFRIAVNLCHDLHRSRRRLSTTDTPETAGNVIGMTRVEAPEGAAERAERNALIRRSILELEPDLRAALVLREVNGFSYDEIAATVRAPLGTVKSRIARARARLQDRLLLYPELFDLPKEGYASHGQ